MRSDFLFRPIVLVTLLVLVVASSSLATLLAYENTSNSIKQAEVSSKGVNGSATLLSTKVAVTPQSADQFVDGIGLNIHLFYDTYISNQHHSDLFTSVVKPLLNDLGVRNVRDHLPGMGSGNGGFRVVAEKLGQLRSNSSGVKTRLLLTTDYTTNTASSTHVSNPCWLSKVNNLIQGSAITCGSEIGVVVPQTPILAVEPPNEVDHCASFNTQCQVAEDNPAIPGTWYEKSELQHPNWPTVLTGLLVSMKSAMQSSDTTKDLPILGNSFVNLQNFASIPTNGGVSNLRDDLLTVGNTVWQTGNAHPYCNDKPILGCLTGPQNTYITNVKNFYGSKPIWITETGYSNYNASQVRTVSDTLQAKYSIRTLVDMFDEGYQYRFLYEFLDEEALTSNDRERNFGIVRSNGTPKNTYNVLKNTISLLQETPGVIVDFKPLTYEVVSQSGNVRNTLLRKSNGKYYVLLRNETATSSDADQNASIQLSFDDPIASIATYRPFNGTSVVGSYTGQSVTIDVPDDLLIAEVTLASVESQGTSGSGGTTGGSGIAQSTPTPKKNSPSKNGKEESVTTSPSPSVSLETNGGEESSQVSPTPMQAPSAEPVVFDAGEFESFQPAMSRAQQVGLVTGSLITVSGVLIWLLLRMRKYLLIFSA